jgi:hypothetical protein
VTDQNVEVKAWEERLECKKKLSKPWKIPSSILLKYHHKHSHEKENRPTTFTLTTAKHCTMTKAIDFHKLPISAHSIRNLKLLILSEIVTIQRFTPSALLAQEEIRFAASCVVSHDHGGGVVTQREVMSTFLAACNLLVRDGNIIISAADLDKEEVTFIVVGEWNLGSTIRGIAKRDGKVIVRELWRKVMSWGRGWEGTTKGVIGSVVEEVLRDIEGEEWVESKAGVWTRIDD